MQLANFYFRFVLFCVVLFLLFYKIFFNTKICQRKKTERCLQFRRDCHAKICMFYYGNITLFGIDAKMNTKNQ